jgi:hypothetical protein
MRERAKQIDAKFAIWSRTGAGTEMALSVPAAVAYVSRAREPGWFRRWRLGELWR